MASGGQTSGKTGKLTVDDPVFKSFNDFSFDDMPRQAEISQRMLRRLKDIENTNTVGPVTPAARAALTGSVVAPAVTDLENEFIELRKHLDRG